MFESDIKKWKATGELTSALLGRVALAINAMGDLDQMFDRMNREFAKYVFTHKEDILTIQADIDRIEATLKRLEREAWFDGGLQAYYKATTKRGHSFKPWLGKFQAMLWGSAGRVLLTIQDALPQVSSMSEFGGAWITLIFDEDSPTPRGGIQGVCGTRAEVCGLMEAFLASDRKFKPDAEVTVC